MQGYLIGSVLYGAIMYSLPFSIGLASQALNLPVSTAQQSNLYSLPC